MKKNRVKLIIILLIIIAIIAVAIGIWLSYKNSRDYDIPNISEEKYFLLYENGKYGVIDANGDIIVEVNYDEIQIPNPTKPVFLCMNENKINIYNEKKENIFNEYNNVQAIEIQKNTGTNNFDTSCLKYEENSKYGLISFDGKKITKAIYDDIKSLNNKEGEFLVKKDDKYTVLNLKGTKMIKDYYDNVTGDGYYNENYKKAGYITENNVENKLKYGYINYEGKTLIKSNSYDEIKRINEIKDDENVYLIVSLDNKYGVLKNDEQIIECKYDNIEYNEETELIKVRNEGKYGVYNLDGNEIVPVENMDIVFRGKRITAKKTNNTIEYDLQGNEIKDNKYKMILSTENPEYSITVTKDNKYGVINTNGTEVVENKYSYLKYLDNNYFAIYSDDNKIGIIDNNGSVILEPKYDVVQEIEGSNLIQVSMLENNLLEIYSKENMKQIISIENAEMYQYDNYIRIVSENELEYINFNGDIISAKDVFKDAKIFPIIEDGKWGFEDIDGNIKILPTYDKFLDFNKYGYASIQKDGLWGTIDKDGNIIIEPTYDESKVTSKPDFIGKYYKVNMNGKNYYTK